MTSPVTRFLPLSMMEEECSNYDKDLMALEAKTSHRVNLSWMMNIIAFLQQLYRQRHDYHRKRPVPSSYLETFTFLCRDHIQRDISCYRLEICIARPLLERLTSPWQEASAPQLLLLTPIGSRLTILNFRSFSISMESTSIFGKK
jgi:hypothetical protein